MAKTRTRGFARFITKCLAVLVLFVFCVSGLGAGLGTTSVQAVIPPPPSFDILALSGAYGVSDTSDDPSDFIGTRPTPRRAAAMGLEISGVIPEARFDDDELNDLLDERFISQVNSFIQAHQASALSINFTTDVFAHQSPDSHLLVSVVITMQAVSATTTSAVATTVINTYYGEIITLSQYNINAVSLVNNRIRSMINANPRMFVPNFSGINADHPFYFNDGRLVIPFGSGGLVPTARNIFPVTFVTENISSVAVRATQFYTLPVELYSVRMVRLAVVTDHFGYDLEWDSRARTAEILDGDVTVATLTIGNNAYSYRNSPQRALEVAPALRLGRTYVPLSFFDEIMGMTATVTADGYIIISRYTPTANADETMSADYIVN